MFKKAWAFALATVIAGSGAAYAATTVINETFDKLDDGVWRIFTNSEGVVEVKDGVLSITNVEGGWKQKGIVLRAPIDLTLGSTIVEIVYKDNKYTQQCPAFVGDGAIDGEDNWNYPGFRITVGPETSDWEALSGFAGVSGSIDKGDSEPFDSAAPFTLKWVLKKNADTVYDAAAFMNDQQKSAASIDMGEFPVTKAYFYFYVSNNDGDGPTVIDSIKITQE